MTAIYLEIIEKLCLLFSTAGEIFSVHICHPASLGWTHKQNIDGP